MKKTFLTLTLVLLLHLPASAITANIDCIPALEETPKVLCSQTDKDGNWVLEIVENEVLGTFSLRNSEREAFLEFETRAEAIGDKALEQGLPLRDILIGETKQFNGYEGGWALLSLQMDIDKKSTEPVSYKLKIHSSPDDTSTVFVKLDKEGLKRLFRSGKKVPEQSRLLASVQEKLAPVSE